MTKVLFVTAALAVSLTAAGASPGAVNAQGCHSSPQHCHSSSELQTMSNGRHFVPGHFSSHSKKVKKVQQ
jgi:hypothetical protein